MAAAEEVSGRRGMSRGEAHDACPLPVSGVWAGEGNTDAALVHEKKPRGCKAAGLDGCRHSGCAASEPPVEAGRRRKACRLRFLPVTSFGSRVPALRPERKLSPSPAHPRSQARRRSRCSTLAPPTSPSPDEKKPPGFRQGARCFCGLVHAALQNFELLSTIM